MNKFTDRRKGRAASPGRPGALAALTMLAALVAGCGLDRISVDVEEESVVEGGGLTEQLLGDIGFPGLVSFDITDTQTFRNEGYTEEDIDAVYTRSFELAVTEPEGADLDFLDSVSFTVKADGEPDEEIAWLDPVPEGASTAELEVDSEADLQPHVVAPEMTIETSASGRRPPQDTTIEARIVFEVDIKIF